MMEDQYDISSEMFFFQVPFDSLQTPVGRLSFKLSVTLGGECSWRVTGAVRPHVLSPQPSCLVCVYRGSGESEWL